MSTSKRFVTKNGLDNNGNSITNLGVSGASLTLSGANALTITTSGATNVTFPTSGTLLTTAGTAATVTTNANLTGPITSVGNATSIASQTGTGTQFVMSASPSITGCLNITGSGAYMPASTTIAAASGASGASLITAQGTAGTAGAAFITFHRPYAYAFHVGIDTDNFFKIGGYSLGAASYKIWHEGVDGAGSGLDADLLDGQQGAYYAPIASPVFTGIPRASSLNIGADTDIYLYESATNALTIRTGGVGTEKYFTFGNDGTLSVVSGGITTTDRILVAGSTAVTQSNGETAYLQLNGTDSRWGIGLSRFSANANGTGIYLGKSRGATVGTLGIVSSGDELGRITFSGDDGTDLNTIAAKITAYVDGTPGLNDMPGRLVLSTTADGASTPTDRVTIDSIGEVSFSSCGVKIQTSRRVTSDIDTQILELRGGTGASSANIELYGGTHATAAGLMVLDAGEHRIRSADGTSEWARIDSTGNVGIGTSTSPVVKLFVYDTGSSTTLQEYGQLVQASFTNISGAINKFGSYAHAYTGASYAGTGAVIGVAGLAQQNAASAGAGFSLIGVLGSITTTSTGTVGNACAFQSGLTTSGGATITNGIAYLAEDHSVGTSKYGFYSSLSSGTNKYGFYSAGTAPNYFAGSLGIGDLPVTGYKLLNYGNWSGNTTYYGTSSQGTFQSDVTASGIAYRSAPNTAAASFTLTNLNGYLAEQGTIGAGSTVTNQYGFNAAASLVGATNNYGFYGNIASGTNRWNFFASGTANNAFNGKVRVGGITVPSATLDVTGTIASTGAITATGGVDKLTTASGVVSVAAATAPTTGQVLMATSATTATWQTPAAGGSVTMSDDTTTNATYYPAISTVTSGTLSALKVSSTKFTFNPSTGTMSATILNSLSDANFKTNVAPLTDSAEVVKALQGVSFDWKDGSGSSYGFIAQEVQKIIPHAVSENDNKLGVNYSAIVPFLVETIKTQEDRIARLEEMVAKLLKA